ncbi:hypothetical protein AHiyo8_58940 [Arthrobacter sp. Hiyo8]|uniref:hypothetical protein n=1 Tax=Arthrobacter sp. Hiyo1 TaxID=1588020 RepID=UPI000683ADDF|nr:hypothetical protein [Arthrobacter sp. Hiyo1]BAS17591.1 hypothetical protein AHiyo8_58940 [Arthrobacter sp. Hiyo8]GAP57951.1 hypothetical protein AHiyo1_09130 [Arthrobacter sp. Hiyo1]
MSKYVSNEDFVIALVTAKDIDEVLKTTGMTSAAAKQRATMLRKKGVKLSRMTRRESYGQLEIARLNALVKRYSTERAS